MGRRDGRGRYDTDQGLYNASCEISVNFGQFYVHMNVQLFKEFVFLYIPHSRDSFKGVYYAE